jgi:3-hydroxyacyl-[acyl-carrier-protein] dehydratase
MQFNLVDRILEVENHKRICAVKHLALGEEYLADHFPTFPVMPGVLMLQALVETGSWLLRIQDDFRYSIVVLREVQTVKYGNFMEPGRTLKITAELQDKTDASDPLAATFRGKGECENNTTFSARVTLTRYNLADRDPAFRVYDDRIVQQLKERYAVLRGTWDQV